MIYTRITKNLVVLLNDTVVKLFFSMKTLVDKYAWVYFGKLPWKWVNTVDLSCTQLKLVMMSWRYVVINKCNVSLLPYMENGSLGSLQMDACAEGGGEGTSMFGSLGMCHSAWYRFMGSSILKKVFNFTIWCLKQGCNFNAFYCLKQLLPWSTSLIHNNNSAKIALPLFFQVKNFVTWKV